MKDVLIVEDSRFFALILRQEIEKLGEFIIHMARDYEEARKLLESQTFFAAILDMIIPGAENGEIVDLAIAKEIPSIVLTGQDDKAFKKRISSKNIVDYVIKESKEDIDHAVKQLQRISHNPDFKVLVVDDSKSFRLYVTHLLNLHLFQVHSAANGEEALSILEEEPDIGLIITDYNMPVMDGLELTKRIRRKHKKETHAIIVISSSQDEDNASRFLKFGANDYVKKPFTTEEFFSRIYLNIENIQHIAKIKTLNDTLKAINDYNVIEQKKAHFKQENIVVNELEDDPQWQVRSFYKAADILSGDSYSIHRKEDGSIIAYMIDGMGHGILPSLTTFAVAAHIRQFINYAPTLDRLGERLIESLREILDEEEQLSYSIFFITPDRKQISYSIGGMYPAYLKDGEKILPLKANSLPILNFTPGIAITTIDVEDFKGLFVYSDGLTEEEFDLDGSNPEAIIQDGENFDRVTGYLKGRKTEDDVSMLLMEYMG